MKQLNSLVIAKVAGGMTIEKYDESTQEYFKNVRTKLQSNLARLEQLEEVVTKGYAGFKHPAPVQNDL